MKQWIKASNNAIDIEKIEKAAMKEFGSSQPGTGCTFITYDGEFVNIYPKLDTHEDLCEWVEEKFDVVLDYHDEEYFIREFSWIRLRSDPNMAIIELPKDKPSSDQWTSLQEWLWYIEDKYTLADTPVYVSVCDSPTAVDVPFRLGTEYFAEDIFKQLRRYYSSGKLYASCTCNKEVCRMSYRELLEDLKKAITRHNEKRMKELSISRYFDKAMRELRNSMHISAAERSNIMKRYLHASYSDVAWKETYGGEVAKYKGYTIDKSWKVDVRGRRIPGTTRYMVVDSEDEWVGDVYKSLREAKDYIDEVEEG